MITDKSCDIALIKDDLDHLLTGGNHLASVLIGRLGAAEVGFPGYKTSIEEAGNVLDGEDLDLWIAWRSMMLFRDRLQDLGVYA